MEIGCNIVFFLALFQTTFAQPNKPTRNIVITAEEEKIRDAEGFAAIKSIHATLDDDNSGSIDRVESADFLKEDLKFGGSDRARREKAFHNNDESITVDDLWENWFQSEERGWNNKQVIEWLTNQVKLPQYANNFLNAKVTGVELPRMAVQNSSYLAATLGIKNFVHRQKLQLKALDLVLFGFQDSSSLAKDIALAGMLGLLIAVLIMFKKHKNRSRQQMEELSTVMNKLRDMENDFECVQNRLEEENLKRQSTDDSENIEMLRNQLREFENERRITEANGAEGFPFALQSLLKRTYEIEWAYLYQQKLECLHEMSEAREFVDKMKRKQTSFMNSLKLATGAASGTDDIDNKIFALKTTMEKIKLALNECTHRWTEIESICGFSITDSFGVSPNVSAKIPAIQLNTQCEKARKFTASLAPAAQTVNNGFAYQTESSHDLTFTSIAEWINGQPNSQNNSISGNKMPDSLQLVCDAPLNDGERPKFSIQGNNSQQDDSSIASSSNMSGSTLNNNKIKNKNRLSKLFGRKASKY